MSNFRTRPVSRDEYFRIIETISSGFVTKDGRKVRPSAVTAFAICLEANLGIRISDICRMRLCDIKYEGGRHHLDIYEKKTDKHRIFTVPDKTYMFIQDYAIKHGIKETARLVPVSPRAIQAHLKLVADYLGLENVSTHSFRKFMALSVYQQNKDVEVVRSILQHASYTTTRAYISCEPKAIEDALNKHIALPEMALA